MECIEDKKKLKLLLILLALSTVIDGLDASIVNVALPTISKEFGVSAGDSSWITLAYIVAIASLLLPFAKIAKNGTMKRFFIWGVVVFTVFSGLCGISGNYLEMVSFRFFQGVGAAIMTAAVPIIIVHLLPANKKGLGMGVLAVASGVSVVLGPSVGGLITNAVSWHWIFFINVPFGIATVFLAHSVIPKDSGYDKSKNPNLLNSALTVAMIAAGLVVIQNLAGSNIPVFAMVVLAAVSIASILLIAYRMHACPEKALISPSLLRRRDFQLLSIAFTMTCMIVMGTQYVLPYFLQDGKGYTATESGLLISIASVFAIALSVPVGKWCDSRGCKLPSVLAGVFRLGFCILFLLAAPNDDMGLLLVGLAVMGCSMAFAGTGLSTALIHHADEWNQDEAATFMLEINYAAASLGVAAYAMIFEMVTPIPEEANVLFSLQVMSSSQIIDAFGNTMLFGCILSIVAIICAAIVPNVIPKKKS